MPLAFELCVQKGGRVRTKKLKNGKYIHICYLNGKSYAGEVKRRKK
jgi:putative hemolysin